MDLPSSVQQPPGSYVLDLYVLWHRGRILERREADTALHQEVPSRTMLKEVKPSLVTSSPAEQHGEDSLHLWNAAASAVPWQQFSATVFKEDILSAGSRGNLKTEFQSKKKPKKTVSPV